MALKDTLIQKYIKKIPDIESSLEEKVNKEQGKGLSINDYTNTDKAEVAKVKDKLDKVNLLDLTYPIGAIYISANNTNPANLFGGEWIEFAKGKTLIGVDTTQTEFNTVLKTGGEKKSSEISCSSRGYGLTNLGALDYEDRSIVRTTPIDGMDERNAEISLLQPYITVYMWKRTK